MFFNIKNHEITAKSHPVFKLPGFTKHKSNDPWSCQVKPLLGAVWTPKPSDFTEPLEKVREPKVFFLGRECDPGKMQMQGVVVYDLLSIYLYILYIYF